MPIDDSRLRMTMRNAEMNAQGFRLEYDKAHLGVGDSGKSLERTNRSSSRKIMIVLCILILSIFFIFLISTVF